jgi:SAM-dependent methyltransferase
VSHQAPDASPPPSGPSSWRDHDDQPVSVPAVPGPETPPFYTAIGDLQGADYRRNAFTAGTEEELSTLLDLAPVEAGMRVLDVGCADGRHLRALADVVPGTQLVGVDVSPGLLDAGRHAARTEDVEVVFLEGDARDLPAVLGERVGTFDVVWSLCQGALGTSPVTDPAVLAGMATALRPGGTLIATFFHALFAARHLVAGDAFDTVGLVHHQRTEVRGPEHARQVVDLWTASYTVRDVGRLATEVGLEVREVRGVQPGAYGHRGPGEVGLDDPELLLVAHRP